MNIFQFCEQFSSTAHAIVYMRNRGLLRQIPPICGRNGCPRHMTQVKNPSFPTDGCQWRCPTHKGNKQSIRAGSFFERAHFELRKGIMLAYFWALSMSSSYVLYDMSIPNPYRYPSPHAKTNGSTRQQNADRLEPIFS